MATFKHFASIVKVLILVYNLDSFNTVLPVHTGIHRRLDYIDNKPWSLLNIKLNLSFVIIERKVEPVFCHY